MSVAHVDSRSDLTLTLFCLKISTVFLRAAHGKPWKVQVGQRLASAHRITLQGQSGASAFPAFQSFGHICHDVLGSST